ncbi:MAG TPA: SurA N-terminal domain-containing protein [Terriglobales bacterium]
MRRFLHITICILLLAPMAAFAAEVIDGVIATVNRKPLLQSDWDDAVRFEAFMQQKPLASVTEVDRASALQRLIDRGVLEIQMPDANYLAPSREEIRADIAKLRAQIPAASDEPGWQKLIAAYGLSQRDVEANVRREMQMMNFIEVRLRPNVHVQPEEVEAYYRAQVLPDMEKAGVKIVTLQEVSPKIHELLVQQRMDELLEAWLHNLRQQTQVQNLMAVPSQGSSSRPEAAGGK